MSYLYCGFVPRFDKAINRLLNRGGGQREDNIDILIETIRHHDLPLRPFEWYLDLRKYGSVPHSGFGLGLERFVAWVCGTTHIRETIPFPRTMARLEP